MKVLACLILLYFLAFTGTIQYTKMKPFCK